MRFSTVLSVLLVACSGSSPPPSEPPAPTPTPTPTPTPIDAAVASTTACDGPPPAPDYRCIQDCGPPVVRQGDPPPGWRWLSPAEVEARERGGCPRCLPAEARIATPDGDVAIAMLSVGARVFTVDDAGRRQVATVLRIATTPVRARHVLARLTLADGRVVAASPEHPVGDGRVLASLAVGARLDGSSVVAVERVGFSGDRTWDLLPSGPTGRYIADGVVLGSTLAATD